MFRTRFSIAAVKVDKDLTSSVKVLNLKTGETKPATSKTTVQKGKEKLIFMCEFFVKDFSNLLSNQFVRVQLAMDDTFNFFPGIGPADILKKKKAYEEVLSVFSLLEKFNVWLEASVVIAADGSLLVTKETSLKEYK